MAKAKRARRTSFRTMESDPDALSVLERLEQLEAEQPSPPTPADAESQADDDEQERA